MAGAATCLITLSTIFRVVSLYDRRYATDADLYYTLQVLPELLMVVLLVVPTLMARACMAGRYPAWRAGEVPGSPWPAQGAATAAVTASAAAKV